MTILRYGFPFLTGVNIATGQGAAAGSSTVTGVGGDATAPTASSVTLSAQQSSGDVPVAINDLSEDATVYWVLTTSDQSGASAAAVKTAATGGAGLTDQADFGTFAATTGGGPYNSAVTDGLQGNYYLQVALEDGAGNLSIVYADGPQAIDTTDSVLSPVSFTTGSGAGDVDWSFTPDEASATVSGYRVSLFADGSTPSDAAIRDGTGAIATVTGTASASVAESGTLTGSDGVIYVPTIYFKDAFSNEVFNTYADVTAGTATTFSELFVPESHTFSGGIYQSTIDEISGSPATYTLKVNSPTGDKQFGIDGTGISGAGNRVAVTNYFDTAKNVTFVVVRRGGTAGILVAGSGGSDFGLVFESGSSSTQLFAGAFSATNLWVGGVAKTIGTYTRGNFFTDLPVDTPVTITVEGLLSSQTTVTLGWYSGGGAFLFNGEISALGTFATIGDRATAEAEIVRTPLAFTSGDWSVADDTAGGIDVTITTLPSGEGYGLTDIEYRVDGGAWTSSGGLVTFNISGLSNGSHDVEIRAVNLIGESGTSGVKSATVTGGAGGITVTDSITYSDQPTDPSNTVLTLALPTTDVLQDDVMIVAIGSDDNVRDNATAVANQVTVDAAGQGWTVLAQSEMTAGLLALAKRMGPTPDTSIDIFRSNISEFGMAVQVWRGVNTTTLLDAAVTTASDAADTTPDPAAITTVTNNAKVIAISTLDDEDTTLGIPAGYGDSIRAVGRTGLPSSATITMASKTVATAGSEDPGVFTGGADAWFAATVALRPA